MSLDILRQSGVLAMFLRNQCEKGKSFTTWFVISSLGLCVKGNHVHTEFTFHLRLGGQVMKVKKIVGIIAFLYIATTLIAFSILKPTTAHQVDTVAINDIVQSYTEQWEDVTKGNQYVYPDNPLSLEYTVISLEGKVLISTGKDISQSINEAVSHRDIMVDIQQQDLIVGKVIIYNKESDSLAKKQEKLLLLIIVVSVFLFAVCTGYFMFLNNVMFRPFQKLKRFAQSVAGGNLDLPLEMDKRNLFGAFSESFDIMREELLRARENERLANKSKKELVAQLSHDIKTPVASIKAVAELMLVHSEDEKEKERLQTIGAKADQINLLITNMFHATLEELQELKVTPVEELSTILPKLIVNADYDRRAEVGQIPACMIVCDKIRLQQVFDNVIQNSYKYADTPIKVTSECKENKLVLTFRDDGTEMKEEDLPFVCEKFYRGKNSKGKQGSGLGLFISKYLMQQMEGDICCKMDREGFFVEILLQIAGKH